MTQNLVLYPQILMFQLKQICQNFQIENTEAFSLGEQHIILPQTAEMQSDESQDSLMSATSRLIENVTTQLYEKCYVRQFGVDDGIYEENVLRKLSEDNLTQMFHSVNDNKDGWDPGWMIYQLGNDGRLFVQKGDRSRLVLAGEYSIYKWPGVMPVIGDLVSVRKYWGSTDVQPQFFFAFGSALSDQFDEYSVIRFYFNVSAFNAPNLMRQLTACLNRYQIPFKFKTLVQAQMYNRTDAAVLYVAKRYYHIVATLIVELQQDNKIILRNEIPLFTRFLIDGVGMAENPKTGLSFGMHRCNLMAQGLVEAWKLGKQNVSAQMELIELAFSKNQLNLNRAYLNPNSEDIFDVRLFDKETKW